MAKSKPGYFRENWKILTALLAPLTLLLAGIVVLMIYETSYKFRVAYDAWWDSLWSDKPAAARHAAITPNVIRYDKQDVERCKDMPSMYKLDTPDAPAPIDLLPAIGLDGDADRKAVNERCVAFAKTVAKMQTVSSHRHYAYLCPGVRFGLGKGFGFTPMPGDKGVMIASTDPNAEKIEIPIAPGRMEIYQQWQFYNMGDGCYVVGYSTNRSRTLEVLPQ